MMYAGNFTGRYLILPQLEIKLDFKPVDIIIFKAELQEHFLSDFEGYRTSILFLNHQNIWDYTKRV